MSIESVELARREWGRPGDRSLLLVHGVGSNAAGWWRTGPDLAALGFHVTAVDLRGHGDSPSPSDYSVAANAADLLAVADTWDTVLGHSFGASVVIAALGERPEWVRRLILEDPLLAILDVDLAVEYVLDGFLDVVDVDAMAERNPSWHREDARFKAEAQVQAGAAVIAQTMSHNPGYNAVADVAALEIPTLLLGADPERNPLVPPALGISLADMNPHIEFHVVPESSHSMHRDQYGEFMEIVSSFLS